LKKVTKMSLSLLLMLSLVPQQGVEAAKDISVTIDGRKIQFPDGKPYVDKNNRTMVPVRFVSENLGYDVKWNGKTKEVKIEENGKMVKLKTNSNSIFIDGKKDKMDTQAKVINGRTYVPLRFISQGLGSDIIFDNKTKIVGVKKRHTRAQGAVIRDFTTTEVPEKKYQIELSRWNIYNDGTHPIETTKGINDALIWAKGNGYNVFEIPSGTYLIDKDNHIEMVGNMTFNMESGAILQKETNGYVGYKLMNIGPNAKNVLIKGGIYKGDKTSHDYYNGAVFWEPNKEYKVGDKVKRPNIEKDGWGYYYMAVQAGTSGSVEPAWNWTKEASDNTVIWKPVARETHEHGYGIITSGAENVNFDGIKAVEFTGDGMAIGGMGSLIDEFYANDFKSGSVDSNGNLIADPTKVRLENLKITHPYFDVQRTFQFLHQKNMETEAYGYIAYFYDGEGKFLSKIDSKELNTPVGWGVTPIPKEAKKMNVVFDVPSVNSNIYLEYWMQGVSKNIIVKNSDFSFNRRQGITVGGGQDILIENNEIHDQKGAAPQSGIDLEAGYNLNNRVTIKNNHFYNNQAYDLILYDGRNAVVDGNRFDSKSIGLAISEPFKYAEIKNNTFNGARIYAYNYAHFTNNKMENALAAFLGKEIIIDGFQFSNTVVNLASSEPFGIKANNITVKNTNKEMHAQFGINRNPIHVKNLNISGQAALDSFSGNATDGSIFDNLVVKDYTRVQLVRGTYNNCVFEAAPVSQYNGWGPDVNNSGYYEFNNCTFKSEGGGLGINSVHGNPDSVIVRNSTFILKGPKAGLSIAAGKKVVFENNKIFANGFTDSKKVLLSIGNGYWQKNEPSKTGDVTIKGNVIETNIPVIGIQSIYSGLDAKSYRIENNTLYNATLDLKSSDVDENNKLWKN